MIDIRFIRNNPELVRKAIIDKNEKADLDKLLELDEAFRKEQYEFEGLRAHQNTVSQEIAKKKRAKEDASSQLEEMTKLAARIKDIQASLAELGAQRDEILLSIPNIPEDSVPIGKDESANEILRYEGEKPHFDFAVKDHLEIAEINGLLDLPRGAKIAGSGFPIYKGLGASLERALINFMLEMHIQKHGFTELMVPLLVNRKAMIGTGQLPKLKEDMYHAEHDDLFLIPTAEVPVTNIYTDEVLSHKELPQKFVSYTPCFRREAGSYGKDTRGLQRLHQFNKVEMVSFTEAEDSSRMLDELLAYAEDILKAFGLHYRVVNLATGDLSFAGQKTYDLEVWAPAAERYLEVSSVSNFGEFQARRANIRYKDAEGKMRHVHTLNGSGVATPRLMIAILESFQNPDGSLNLPEVLKPWLQLKI